MLVTFDFISRILFCFPSSARNSCCWWAWLASKYIFSMSMSSRRYRALMPKHRLKLTKIECMEGMLDHAFLQTCSWFLKYCNSTI